MIRSQDDCSKELKPRETRSVDVLVSAVDRCKELEDKVEGLTTELHEVLSVLLKVSPEHVGWVKMNFPDYKE